MLNENVLNENAWKMEVIQYIAGFLVKKLKNVINCSYCSELLESKFNHSEHDLSLISKKTEEGCYIHLKIYSDYAKSQKISFIP